MAASSSSLQSAVLLLLLNSLIRVEASSLWCVARSDASFQALQTALDYACWAGADCTPIQPNGLCFLPNTIQAHASYAFNSYFQRKSMSPGSCDFSGTANIARTDPSYGSCVYPGSLSTAGGGITTPTTTPTTADIPNTLTPPGTPTTAGLTPPISTDDDEDSKASICSTVINIVVPVGCVLILLFTDQSSI
ncbi:PLASMODESMATA CALLOSE-BINDING PROTEIN 3 [Linum grandiflorum]